MTNRKVTESKEDLVKYLSKESDDKDLLNDKLRLLIIGILCMNDLAELESYIVKVEKAHPDKEELKKIRVMFEKKKVIVKEPE